MIGRLKGAATAFATTIYSLHNHQSTTAGNDSDPIFIASNNPWGKDLQATLRSLGINTQKIAIKEDDTIDIVNWMRDYAIPNPENENIIFIQNHTDQNPTQPSCRSDRFTGDWQPQCPPHTNPQENESRQQILKSLLESGVDIQVLEEGAGDSIQGGQLFNVVNSETNKRFIIVGEDLFTYAENPSKTKDLISNLFNVDMENIIVIPNITYHIDLQMSFIGNDTFILNSFEETFKNFPEQRKYHESELVKEKDDKSKKIKEKLESCGFKVIMCCGALYLPNREPLDPTAKELKADLNRYVDHEDKIFMGAHLESLGYYNGVPINIKNDNDNNNKWVYLIPESANKKHMEIFKQILEEENVKPIIIQSDIGLPASVLVNRYGGGLCCTLMSTSNQSFRPDIMHPQDISP